MTASTPSQRILDQLVPRLTDLGYRYRKTWHRFSKPFAHGTQEFSVGFDGRGGLVVVDVAFFLQFSKLQALYEKAMGTALPFVLGGPLHSVGAKPWNYDVFVHQYATMTLKQKAAVDPNLVHPQERIDGAVAFVLDAHERYALPLFEKVQTYPQLLDMMLDGLRGGISYMQLCRFGPDTMALSLLLGAALGRDPGEVRELAEVYALRHKAEIARTQVAKADSFLATASPEDLQLE